MFCCHIGIGGTMKFRLTLLIHSVILSFILAWSPAANCATPEPRLIKDINATASNASSNPSGFVSAGAFTYFVATNGINGQELWKSDGTETGTVMVKDIYPGVSNSNPVFLTNVNGTLFFTATNGTNGEELWKSDGTEAGTVMVKDIRPGTGRAYPFWLVNMNNNLYFNAFELTHGTELWKSDGTEAGTVLVKDIRMGGASDPQYLTVINGILFFTANDGTSGQELWNSDGTEAGTVLVKDIWPGYSGSNPEQLTNVNGKLFFIVTEATNGKKLWKSDGTEAGTIQVKDFYPGTSYPSISSLTNVNGTLFFTADDGIHGIEIWKSDGTTSGTVMIKDMYPGIVGSYPANLTNVNGTLLFTASDPIYGSELWKSDGTDAGTVPVKDTYPGPGGTFPQNLTNVNGTLYFTANNGIDDRELWKSDGSADGTFQVNDIYPGSGSSNPANLTNVNGNLYFAATDPIHGTELWILAPQASIPPVVTTGTPSSVSISAATLNGTVSDGGADTTVSFEYGLDTTYGIIASAGTVTANSGLTPVSATINGLTCGSVYHYRIVAANSAGTTNDSDNYLFVPPCPAAPNVSTGLVTAISTTGATLNGYAYSFGEVAAVSFDYGQTTDYGSSVIATVSGNGDVSGTVTGLTCGTSYHYRINGQNSIGTSSGLDSVFTTTPCPPPGSVIISTIAGNGTTTFAGDGGAATSAGFYYPYDVAADSSGNIYIADTFNYRIRKLAIDTGIISTVAGTGTSGFSVDGILATDSKINGSYGVSVDAAGNIYIADTYNNRIRKVDAATGIISTVAGNGTASFSGDGGPATSASLNNPRKVILDSDGNIYIADTNNNRIRMVDASTGIISTIAGNGSGAFAGDGGSATSASLYWPYSVAADNSGNLYIADYMNMRIRKVEKATGIISTVAGKSGTGLITYTGEGGPATSAQISTPYGVTVDGAGNIFIAASYRILKVDAVTGILNTVAGNGVGGFSGDGGIATTANLNAPSGITIDAAGNLIIADTSNHRIRKVVAPDLTITITASTNGSISGPSTVNYSGNATYTITPATGYHVVDVLVDGISVGPVTSYILSNITINHTISATFAIDTFAITATAGANGSLSGPATVNYGSNATYTITPAIGYRVSEVVVDGVSIGAVASYLFDNVTSNHMINASFASLPDLVVSSVNGPAIASRGKSIGITSSFKNQGETNAGSFTVSFYLSMDRAITSTDTLLGNRLVSQLNAGSTASIAGTFIIPRKISSGRYYIGAIADSGSVVTEIVEVNNSRASENILYVK